MVDDGSTDGSAETDRGPGGRRTPRCCATAATAGRVPRSGPASRRRTGTSPRSSTPTSSTTLSNFAERSSSRCSLATRRWLTARARSVHTRRSRSGTCIGNKVLACVGELPVQHMALRCRDLLQDGGDLVCGAPRYAIGWASASRPRCTGSSSGWPSHLRGADRLRARTREEGKKLELDATGRALWILFRSGWADEVGDEGRRHRNRSRRAGHGRDACVDRSRGRRRSTKTKRRSTGSGAASPFFEPGLPELIDERSLRGGLSFEVDPSKAVVPGAEVVFICVGTPANLDGEANLVAVERAALGIARDT